jgi:hypothetical protein
MSSFIESLHNSGDLLVRHATGNYKVLPKITEDDVVFHMLSAGKKKIDMETLNKIFNGDQYHILSALRELKTKRILTETESEDGNHSYVLDVAKVIKKDDGKVMFTYPSKIKATDGIPQF